MTAYVEECRREWRRLGVPDILAEDMATELEADLAEAEADGISTAEMLGERDPRRFAATWANERGIVAEPPRRKRSRKRVWVLLGVGLVLLGFVLGIADVAFFAKPSVRTSGPPPERVRGTPPIPVRVPNLVGLKACRAKRLALDAGLEVHAVPRRRCDAVVIGQRPVPGQVVPRHTHAGTVTFRLRG